MKNFRLHLQDEDGETTWEEQQAEDEMAAGALMTGGDPGVQVLQVFEFPYFTYEYSVCVDCFMYSVNGDLPEYSEHDIPAAFVREAINGHFSCGIAPTEDDPNGEGYEEFSRACCEICNSSLAGSRHGLTLFRPR